MNVIFLTFVIFYCTNSITECPFVVRVRGNTPPTARSGGCCSAHAGSMTVVTSCAGCENATMRVGVRDAFGIGGF